MSIRDLAIPASITPKTLTDLEYGRRRSTPRQRMGYA